MNGKTKDTMYKSNLSNFYYRIKKQKNQRYIIFVKYVEGEHFYFFFVTTIFIASLVN